MNRPQATTGMDDLEEAMTHRIDAVRLPDPAERAAEQLREPGRAYVDFALREPGLFTVAFTTVGPPGKPAPPDHPAGPYAVLNAVLDGLVAAGSVTPERRVGADVGCWATVHGFSELCVHGALRDLSPDQRAAMLESVLAMVHRGLTA